MEDHCRLHIDQPLLNVLNLREYLITFNKVGDETLKYVWFKFQKVLASCPSQWMINKAYLQSFYRGTTTETRGIIDQSFLGDIPLNSYEVVAQTIDNIARTEKRKSRKPRVGLTCSPSRHSIQETEGARNTI